MLYTIYKIHSDKCDYVYVGSTRNLTRRRHQHKNNCNNEGQKNHNIKLYKTIRENGGWDCFKLVPIEEYECDTIQQAHIREQHWINELKPQMNMYNAIQDVEERQKKHRECDKKYREANREKHREYDKKYSEANKERKREYDKKYRENKKSNTIVNTV